MTVRKSKRRSAQRNFIVQQGLAEPEPASCGLQFGALMFQPRVVMGLVLVGLILQHPLWWAALGATLWWSALLPRWNPFDALYNATVGARSGAVRLTPAPAPRRFSQGMAGTFALGIAAALASGLTRLAWGLEAFFSVAVLSLAFGRLCVGSFLYHLLGGRAELALRTLPWSRPR